MYTAGGVVSGSGVLATVAVTTAELPWFPAASRATAFIVCEPCAQNVVYHARLYGAAVEVPCITLSIGRATAGATTLSEAAAVTLNIPDTVEPLQGERI